MFQILLPLSRPALIAGLILGTKQAVGTALPKCFCIYVAMTIAYLGLDMASVDLKRLQGPSPTHGIGEECAEFAAKPTCATELVGPPPVFRRLQVFGDAGMQMRGAGDIQSLDGLCPGGPRPAKC